MAIEQKEYIYALTDDVGDIRYIGKTNNIKHRLVQHKSMARKGDKTHKSCWIRSMFKKNLEPNIKIIGEYDKSIINGMEMYWIAFWGRVCKLTNLTIGGDGRTDGKRKPLSTEHKNKISEGVKGTKRSYETRKKMSESMKGKKKNTLLKKRITSYRNGEKIKTYTTMGEIISDNFNYKSIWASIKYNRSYMNLVWEREV